MLSLSFPLYPSLKQSFIQSSTLLTLNPANILYVQQLILQSNSSCNQLHILCPSVKWYKLPINSGNQKSMNSVSFELIIWFWTREKVLGVAISWAKNQTSWLT